MRLRLKAQDRRRRRLESQIRRAPGRDPHPVPAAAAGSLAALRTGRPCKRRGRWPEPRRTCPRLSTTKCRCLDASQPERREVAMSAAPWCRYGSLDFSRSQRRAVGFFVGRTRGVPVTMKSYQVLLSWPYLRATHSSWFVTLCSISVRSASISFRTNCGG